MENRPAFFKFFIPEINENELEIPPGFIRRIEGTLPETVVLRDRYNNLWQVKVDQVDSNWCLTDGWKNFLEDNFIKGGEMIIFDYFGQGFFGIKIYGGSGFETKGVGDPKCNNTENHENMTNVKDDGHEEQSNDGGGATAAISAIKSRRKRNTDLYGAEIFRSGLHPQPVNPYFVIEVKQQRKGELLIPVDVIKNHKLELPEQITFVDPKGEEYRAKRKIWKDGRTLYKGEWRKLCNVNLAKNEDKCVYEFIKPEGGDLYISVTFVHKNRQ